jgi:hypothetical protein
MEFHTEQNVSRCENGVQRLRGMKIRDEFLCPITYEVLRDPVIAADGNTYERSAIQKWIEKTQTSPLSGETLEHILLSANRTLKKIIQDLIAEGGVGLYTVDSVAATALKKGDEVKENGIVNINIGSNQNSDVKQPGAAATVPKIRVVDLHIEKVLMLKCVGPRDDENEWIDKNFELGPRGCVGGRNIRGSNNLALKEKDNEESNSNSLPTPNYLSEDMIVFKHGTISKRHFEMCLINPNMYAVRDLGSVAGTFLRMPYTSSSFFLPLNVGAATDVRKIMGLSPSAAGSGSGSGTGTRNSLMYSPFGEDKNGLPLPVVLDHMIPAAVRRQGNSAGDDLPGQRMWPSMTFLIGRHTFIVERIDDNNNEASNKKYLAAGARIVSAMSEPKSSDNNRLNSRQVNDIVNDAKDVLAQIKDLSIQDAESKNECKGDAVRCELIKLQKRLDGLQEQLANPNPNSNSRTVEDIDKAESKSVIVDGISKSSSQHPYIQRRCVITCIGPEGELGAPNVGKSFIIGAGGAVVGRKPKDNISFQGEHKSVTDTDIDTAADVDADALERRILFTPLLIPIPDISLSSEHARIIMDPRTGAFSLCDGAFTVTVDEINSTLKFNPVKKSLFGSWLRLSAATKRSPWYEIRAGMEVQMALFRFAITQSDDTILEKEVNASASEKN